MKVCCANITSTNEGSWIIHTTIPNAIVMNSILGLCGCLCTYKKFVSYFHFSRQACCIELITAFIWLPHGGVNEVPSNYAHDGKKKVGFSLFEAGSWTATWLTGGACSWLHWTGPFDNMTAWYASDHNECYQSASAVFVSSELESSQQLHSMSMVTPGKIADLEGCWTTVYFWNLLVTNFFGCVDSLPPCHNWAWNSLILNDNHMGLKSKVLNSFCDGLFWDVLLMSCSGAVHL